MKKFILAVFLLFNACSLSSNIADNPAREATLSKVDISAGAQARYKTQWLANVSKKVFEGRGKVDVFGGGPSSFFDVFAFDAEGNLHDAGTPSTYGWYSLHRVILFKSGTEAVVMFYKSATGDRPMQEQVYALEIRGDKIYRTQYVVKSGGKSRAMGFSSYADWDKASYSDYKLAEFAALDPAAAYPSLKVPDPNS